MEDRTELLAAIDASQMTDDDNARAARARSG